jgi:hypothetical protein
MHSGILMTSWTGHPVYTSLVQVQLEDIALCEGVQQGLSSPAYDTGRFVTALSLVCVVWDICTGTLAAHTL